MGSFKHEEAKGAMVLDSYIPIGMFFCCIYFWRLFWIYLYRKVKVKHVVFESSKLNYVITSFVGFILVALLSIGGIRGDFKKSTRPISLVDANTYVQKTQHADVVLNSTFTF